MTYSTKQALVEHVARAIMVTPTRNGRFSTFIHEDEASAAARAAIRATLEWARDSVSEGMRDAVYPYISGSDRATKEDADPIIHAALSALIQELDKGDGG